MRRRVGPLLTKLEHYRNRHAQYRTDPDLQAAHAACPWLVTRDDREFANNYADLVSERATDSPGEFRMRRAHAYQAYWEHMPLRRMSHPRGPDMRIYRRFSWGDLAELLVLDTRQYRTDQPNGDGQKPPSAASESPAGTLLGADQRRWLLDRLDRSPALWNVLAQQVMMAAVDRIVGPDRAFSMDQWPGYEFERRRLLRFFRDRAVRNPLVLTGDIHSNWANELTTDFEASATGRTVVGAEFVGTSISSGGDGVPGTPLLERLQRENPFVKYQNGQRGYVRLELSRGCCRADYRVLNYVTKPGSPIRIGASFLVEPGDSRLQRV